MKKVVAGSAGFATALVLALALAPTAKAQTKQLTLCWAAWDPANALVQLSKDFTARTGTARRHGAGRSTIGRRSARGR